MAQKWPKNGPKMVQKWGHFDPSKNPISVPRTAKSKINDLKFTKIDKTDKT